jgi:hypothetical protein
MCELIVAELSQGVSALGCVTACELTAGAWNAGVERDREQQLSDLERERLEDMLRQLRVERSDIRTAMLFVLDHASSAAEISEVLVASLTLSETPAHLKVSRCAQLDVSLCGCASGPTRHASAVCVGGS